MKGLKIFLLILCIIVLIILFALAFVKLYKPFGASPNKKDKEDYAKRSEIFNDGKFKNTGDFNLNTGWEDKFKDRTTKKGVKPEQDLPFENYKYTEANIEDVLVTWFGHSSILIQINGKNILVDPIFEDLVSPVSFTGVRRYSPIPVRIEDLPNIDAILLTHDHYDHTSYKSLTALENKTSKYLVPLGIDKDLEKFGISKEKIQNMAWWEETDLDGLKIACTPSRHFSSRYLLDKDVTLWCSWIVQSDKYTIFDSGDTGYGDHFKKIYEKYGEIDFALFDGAQYNEAWHDVHLFPEETVEAAIDIHSKLTMLQHHSAFILSNHSWDDPIDRFTKRAKEKNILYVTPILGETFNIKEYEKYQTEWWKEIN